MTPGYDRSINSSRVRSRETTTHGTLSYGLPASPGAASGQIVFTAEKAKELTNPRKGKSFLFVKKLAREDIEGMVVSEATCDQSWRNDFAPLWSHEEWGTCCVTGCESLTVNEETNNYTS